MKTLLNWHGNRSDYVSILTRTSWRTQGPQGGRDRVLNDAELKAIWPSPAPSGGASEAPQALPHSQGRV